jgi:hypothetical protein
VLEFERRKALALDPNDLVADMLPHMQEAMRDLAPKLVAWLGRIET